MVKHIPLSDETHALLKKYATKQGKFLSHIGENIIRNYLETRHDEIESKGEMTIEEDAKKPKTIVKILKESEL